MERCAEYLGYRVAISYPWVPRDGQAPMGNLICAGCEYTAIAAQHHQLVERLKTDLESIPQRDLSCRSVIAKTQQSELFRVFIGVSKYFNVKFDSESFAREMAQDASKLMDVAYITSDEARLLLFCMLTCIGFIDMEAIISDVSLVDAKGDVLKFICEYSDKIYPNEKTYKKVTVSNLSNTGKREVTTRFVGAPTFAENDLPAEQLAAE